MIYIVLIFEVFWPFLEKYYLINTHWKKMIYILHGLYILELKALDIISYMGIRDHIFFS